MGTIVSTDTAYGYCPVDKRNVTIGIMYNSPQLPNEDRAKKRFFKSQNLCYYLSSGKCHMGNNCPIFKAAAAEIIKNYSNRFY